MRKLGGFSVLETLSPEVFSVLQFYAANEPLLPNMRTLDLWYISRETISFIPFLLSPRITIISIVGFGSQIPKATVASMIATFPKLCPNLQEITLYSLPRDPMTAAALSGMVLASNRNTLQCFHVDYPLTNEARQVVYNLPNLRSLLVVIEKDSPLPPVVLPNLTDLSIRYGHESDWLQMFRRATLGPLEAITFHSTSETVGDFLEAFERVALAASVQHTLSKFRFYTICSWNPNYSSLLPFTQITTLAIRFSCHGGCSSTVDDDIITNLARAMPRLEALELSDPPCREIPTGVTARGLAALAHHCPYLSTLCIHFQAASLCVPPAISKRTSDSGSAALRRDCALRDLEVGEIPVPEESVLVVALTLAQLFPRLEGIDCDDGEGDYENWKMVVDTIRTSREVIDHSSEEHPLSAPRSSFIDTYPGATLSPGTIIEGAI